MRRAGPLVLGLVLLPTPLAAGSLVCWWLLVASATAGRSRTSRAILALFVCSSVVVAVLTALAVLRAACSPRVLVAVLLLTTFLVVRRRADRPAPWATPADVWAAGFGLLTFVVLYAPFVGASTGRTMALMSQTTDGATHVELVAAVLRQRGYIQLAHPGGLSPEVDHYPTGWHGNVWLLAELVLGRNPSTGGLVRVVALAAITGYALLCALAARAALALARYDERPHRGRGALALACLGLSTLLGFGVFLLQLASYTQVLALAAVLALVLVAEDARRSSSLQTLVALAALAVVTCHAWYLLAPVVGIGVLVVATSERPPYRHLVPLTLISAPLCLYPLLTGPSRLHVDEGGSTLLPTIAGVLALLVITAIGITHATSGGSLVARVQASAAVAALLTMVVLVARQGFVPKSGVSYYGAKLLLSTFLLGSVLAAAAVLRAGRPLLVVLVIGFGLGAQASAWASFPPVAGDYQGHLDPVVLQAQVDRHPHGPPRGTDVVVADGCDRVGDMVASKWLYDTSLAWPDGLRAALNDYAAEPPGDTTALEERLRDPTVGELELWVRHPCDSAALSTLERDAKVRVVRVP